MKHCLRMPQLFEILASVMFGALTSVMLINPLTVTAQEAPSSSRSWAILIHGPQVYTKDID